MVENRKKHRQNSHPMNHCPTSEGVNGRASGPVLQSVFLAVFDLSALLAVVVVNKKITQFIGRRVIDRERD